jgi:hypothetical protein
MSVLGTEPHAEVNRRNRLPNRRCHQVDAVHFRGRRCYVGSGWHDDGRLAEIFISARKAGSDADTDASDLGILLSLLLQHGATPAAIRHSLSPDGLAARALDLAVAAP